MNKLSISISSEISNIVKVENFVETFTHLSAQRQAGRHARHQRLP